MGDPPDFSALKYWTERFAGEKEFEWLGRSEDVVPLVRGIVEDLLAAQRARPTNDDTPRRALRILHFGCGSSSLGPDLQSGLSAAVPVREIQIVDADYVRPSLLPSRAIPVIQLDVLDLASLAKVMDDHGEWDMLIDKSTADAISCGPDVIVDGSSLEPIEVLCDNLARITKRGGRWVCISYSATRFDHLSPPLISNLGGDTVQSSEMREKAGWRLLERRPLGSTSLAEGRKVRDGKVWRTVYEPETPVWVYVLERT